MPASGPPQEIQIIMPGKTLEFFFDYTSPYSYLASTQVEPLVARTGATLVWRPFFLGGVMKSTQNTPPIFNPFKRKHLFKDLQDWARHYQLPPLKLHDPFPMNALHADRLGLVALEQGAIVPFTHAVYKAAFVEGKDIADSSVLTSALVTAGLNPADALSRAGSDDIKAKLKANTDEAVGRGAYGAPSFFIGDDYYVGNDRLQFVEAALR
jgi:2-hydroxychromene-2-carboxylate isomerase